MDTTRVAATGFNGPLVVVLIGLGGLLVWAGTHWRSRPELFVGLTGMGAALGAASLLHVLDLLDGSSALNYVALLFVATGLFAAGFVTRKSMKVSVGGISDFQLNDTETPTGDGPTYQAFVADSQDTEIKLIGLDCAEILSEGIPGVTQLYAGMILNKKLRFRVILTDPGSDVPGLKRAAEVDISKDEDPDRIYRKTLGSARVAVGYAYRFPESFEVRFLNSMPLGFVILNGDKGICVWYSNYKKGWQSPMIVCRRTQGGLYEFLDQYFESAWKDAARMAAYAITQQRDPSTEGRVQNMAAIHKEELCKYIAEKRGERATMQDPGSET